MTKANQSTGVTVSSGRSVADEAQRHMQAHAAYRAKQSQLEAETAAREAAQATETEQRSEAIRGATRAAFEGG